MNCQVIESGDAACLLLLLVETMICIISLCWENSNRDVLLYSVYIVYRSEGALIIQFTRAESKYLV